MLACFRESAASHFGLERGGLRGKPSVGCVVDTEPRSKVTHSCDLLASLLRMCFFANKDFNPPLGRLLSATILWWALFAGYDPKCSLFASGPPLILISILATDVGSVHYSSWDALFFFQFAFACCLSVCLCRRCAHICSLSLQLVDARRADSRPDTHAARCSDLTHFCEYLIHVCQQTSSRSVFKVCPRLGSAARGPPRWGTVTLSRYLMMRKLRVHPDVCSLLVLGRGGVEAGSRHRF